MWKNCKKSIIIAYKRSISGRNAGVFAFVEMFWQRRTEMALLHVNFFSDVLGKCVNMDVILPQRTKEQIGLDGAARQGKYPTLYLLHGMSDDHTCWNRRTSIERYVSSLGIAVVMPNADLSWYTDTTYQQKYLTYLSEELPMICREFFPNMSDRPEETFVAGNSMGGYGAFKLALTKPETFGYAAGLSAAINLQDVLRRNLPSEDEQISRKFWESVFGPLEQVEDSENDLLRIAGELKESGRPLPKLYEVCGTEDFLYEAQKETVKGLQELGYDITYREGAGTHCWDYWDVEIQNILKWLPI